MQHAPILWPKPGTNGSGPFYTQLLFLPSEAMAKGELASGWQQCLHDWGAARALFPVTQHGPSPDGRAYAVGHADKGKLRVVGFDHIFTEQQAMTTSIVDITPFTGSVAPPQPNGVVLMDNLLTYIISASFRGTRLYLTAADRDAADIGTVRVIGVDVRRFPNLTKEDVVLDHAVDANRGHALYPALDVNKEGDVAVAFTRAGPQTFPSIEYVTHRHGQQGLAHSTILKAGEGSLPANMKDGKPAIRLGYTGPSARWIDCAGAATDPEDETSIWFLSAFGNAKNGASLWISKVVP
jgi:hypothetical protein